MMMCEKGKELKLEEEMIVDHWSHEHPLTLVETGGGYACYGCERRVSIGEKGYVCSNKCEESIIWHEECAKVPQKIRHPMHPQHTLIQHNNLWYWRRCAICGTLKNNIIYRCTSLECAFKVGLECAQESGLMDATDDDDDERSRHRIIRHPSHPDHELRLLRECAFMCKACGSTHQGLGDSFLCTVCDYWIHHSCASLPSTLKREDHHHQLSLSFRVPLEYIKFDYRCEVCRKVLILKYWIYHCQLCRYVVHGKCVFNKLPHIIRRNNANDKDIIQFPIDNLGEELIRAFVIREGGAILAPIPCDDEIVNSKFKFHYHEHDMSLISLSSYGGGGEEELENSDDDECGRLSDLICDGCTSPILEKKHVSSSSSSYPNKSYYYMSCTECKYCLHLSCFYLPPRLLSLPLLHDADHELALQPSDKLEVWRNCNVCNLSSNGLFYGCTICSFKADIKCASLPNTIYHTAHPQHNLNYHHNRGESLSSMCAAGCLYPDIGSELEYYGCGNCEFKLHVGCAVLPASVMNHKWDKKHRLLLRWDASEDHPDAFCCDACEKEMNPKMQMYHCRPCDISFHPECFIAISGYLRNVKFGQQYLIEAAHHHPLTYQLLLSTKRRCNACHGDRYGLLGFYCASCNFFICLFDCTADLLEKRGVEMLEY